MKGQLSAEMLILIVVVLAIVGIAAVQMMSTAKETGQNLQNQTERLNAMTAESIKSREGEACVTDDDCMEGLTCESYRCY